MVWWDADLVAIKDACKGRIGEIAEKLSLHRTSLSRKLNGHIRFTRWELNDIAEILDRDISEFIIDRSPSKTQRMGSSKLVNSRE